ncbi:MAG: DUF4097 family beta strand repeat-containing protein [Pyrinomonadaceae bacterium]
MISGKRNLFIYSLLLTVICLSGLAVSAQEKSKTYEFCSHNNWSNGDKVSYSEKREMTIAATGSLSVDGRQNGGIKVVGENRSDILIQACVQTWGKSEAEAQSIAKAIRIEAGSVVRAENLSEDMNGSVSYHIFVPRATNLNLKAHNGGISISSVQGTLDFETTNGGIKLEDVGGNVRGRTANGGVKVDLTGTSWIGTGLDVETTNGGVKLSLPSNYSANVETGTVNGGFKSDFAELNPPKDEKDRWSRPKRVNASLNGGGAPIRVITTNGGVKVSQF